MPNKLSFSDLEKKIRHYEKNESFYRKLASIFRVIPQLSSKFSETVLDYEQWNLQSKAHFVRDNITKKSEVSAEDRAKNFCEYSLKALNLNEHLEIGTIAVYLPAQDGKTLEQVGSFGELSELIAKKRYHRALNDDDSFVVKTYISGGISEAPFTHDVVVREPHDRYIVPLKISENQTIGVVEFIAKNHHKISERQKMVAREIVNECNYTLNRNPDMDELTRLPNRKKFNKHLSEKIREYYRGIDGGVQCDFSVGYIDIGDFKFINDTYGHSVGDGVLRLVADFIKGNLKREHEAAYRIGGDEFAVILSNAPSAGAEGWRNRITAEIPKLIGNIEAYMMGKGCEESPKRIRDTFDLDIGVATMGAGLDSENLVKLADENMYKIKYARKGHPGDLR